MLPGGTVLTGIAEPRDMRALDARALDCLADEIREFLVRELPVTDAHLASNLGVVELTIALHRVFESPRDAILFDTGHQTYVHKILTGRRAGFAMMRQSGGLSGFPSRSESDHDWVESAHASTALSYADGLAKAFRLRGELDRTVVAVVGDGALSGGMCWEALNNIATSARPIIMVLNDNGREYPPTTGAVAHRLARLRVQHPYRGVMQALHTGAQDASAISKPAYAVLHAVKAGVRSLLGTPAPFTDLDIAYLGPVDGHNRVALEEALRHAKKLGGPVVVHAVTSKGRGSNAAHNGGSDFRQSSTAPKNPANQRDWMSVFADELAREAEHRPDLVALTTATADSSGLERFGMRFPERLFDVGTAEQHAVTSAAGLALGGLHPVVSIAAPFFHRAFDQLLMDVALLRQPVTVILRQAGITGPDGASRNGVWDLSMLGIVPWMRVAAPRDAATLREELHEALAVTDGPTAIRFPQGPVAEDFPAIERIDGVDVLWSPAALTFGEVLLVSVGPCAEAAVAAAKSLCERGLAVTVLDPRWVLPVPETLVKLAEDVRLVVTVEEGCVHGGIGASLSALLRTRAIDVPHREIGVPRRFLEHGTREQLHAELGFTPADISRRVFAWFHGEEQAAQTTRRLIEETSP